MRHRPEPRTLRDGSASAISDRHGSRPPRRRKGNAERVQVPTPATAIAHVSPAPKREGSGK